MSSQIRPQAPLLVVPISPCLIFMFYVLSALPGFRSRFSQETLCIAKLMTANCSAENPAQHMRRTSSIAHISNTCNVPVALDMHTTQTAEYIQVKVASQSTYTEVEVTDSWQDSYRKRERRINRCRHKEDLAFHSESLAADAVLELARRILHPAVWRQKKWKRACGGMQTIGMCCTCATSCGELSSRIALSYTILSAIHRSSTDKLRCSQHGLVVGTLALARLR